MSTISDAKIEAVLKDAIKVNHIQAYEQQFKFSFYTNIFISCHIYVYLLS